VPSLRPWHSWQSATGAMRSRGQHKITSLTKLRIYETVLVSEDPETRPKLEESRAREASGRLKPACSLPD
jgi:hypothetical protein